MCQRWILTLVVSIFSLRILEFVSWDFDPIEMEHLKQCGLLIYIYIHYIYICVYVVYIYIYYYTLYI